MDADAGGRGAGGGVGDDEADEHGVSAASVGITLVMLTVPGPAGGYYLGRWLGFSSWLTMIGLGIGITAGFVNLFRATMR